MAAKLQFRAFLLAGVTFPAPVMVPLHELIVVRGLECVGQAPLFHLFGPAGATFPGRFLVTTEPVLPDDVDVDLVLEADPLPDGSGRFRPLRQMNHTVN